MVSPSGFRFDEPCSNPRESGNDLTVVDPIESSQVHRRLTMLGRDDDRGAIEETAAAESGHHLTQRLVNEGKRIGQDHTWGRAISKITAFGVA